MKKLIVLALSVLLVVSLCSIFASAEEKNVAQGKTYTYTGAYTDANGVAQYPDKGGVLTNGVAAKDGNDLGYDKACWVGMNIGGKDVNGSGKFEIVVNLGSSVSDLTKFTVNTQTCGGGVSAPKEVEIQVSADNKSYTSAGKTNKSTKIYDGAKDDASKDYGIYEFTVSTTAQTAQYVKYIISFNQNWCFVSEVAAITGAAPATSTPDTSSEAKSAASSTAASSTAASSTATSSKAPSTAASTPSNADTSSDGEGGLSTPAIIGIAAAAVVVIGVIVFVIVKKKKD